MTRGSVLAAFFAACVVLAMIVIGAASAQGVEVRKPTVTFEDNAFVLDAQFDIQLTPTLEDALNKGVPLYFLLEFELIRPRWYWFSEKVLNTQQQYRLAYNALTRQYRLGVGSLFQNFGSLAEALDFLSRVRRRQVLEPGTLVKGDSYT